MHPHQLFTHVGRTFLITLLLFAISPTSGQASDVDSFRSALINYFLPLNYVPVLVNRGYVVGDVIDFDGVNLFARSSHCFPTLKQPIASDVTLEDAVEVDSAGLSFGLKLRQFFDSSVGANLSHKFRIRFSDLKVIAATRLDLKEALDRSSCPELIPLIDGTVTILDRKKKPFFIISEIIYGKREASLELTDKAHLSADADNLAKAIADASVQIQVSDGGVVMVKSDTILPIAMKPLTVPTIVTLTDFNGVRGDPQISWEPTECYTPENCSALFSPFAQLVKSSKPTLENNELDQ